MKNYREIEIFAGNTIEDAVKECNTIEDAVKECNTIEDAVKECNTIEDAVKELNKHEDLVCIKFNEKMLYSDIDDLDSAYKKITGKTKSEFDEARRIENEKYQQEKKEHKEAIPKLTIEWVKKGEKILDKKHHKLWIKIVPIRLGDMYRGMELGNCLEIVEQLNKGAELEEVKPLIEEQGHSGMSFGLVCSMVKEFSDRGEEFVKYARA